ncbi:hypothetical protein B0181_10845 [Moraxella caviae]|uniref:Uncharacterized protein n=1 Tax=Moraxella caviae TaxID=34060 RepID=A0A1S9ZUS5_9GAMM|nr:hypothetical protein [Moraxella caviae]OOR87209.1 hypothetical protein B0181_10845 [Moraxella caviae]STZ09928.1 Uncharacterised protein [Moraxella caviae]
MKQMSKILLAASLLALTTPSFAKVTPIKFAKGSYCGSFSGNYAGRTFTLGLGAGQTLEIRNRYANPIVRDPKGRKVYHEAGSEWVYFIKTKGTYKITLHPFGNEGTYDNITFCAY